MKFAAIFLSLVFLAAAAPAENAEGLVARADKCKNCPKSSELTP